MSLSRASIELLLGLLGRVEYPLAAPDAVEKAQQVRATREELEALAEGAEQ